MAVLGELKEKVGSCCKFSDIVLLCALVFVGGFNDFVSCLISFLLCIFLGIKIYKNKTLKMKISWLSVAVFVMVAFYGITAFWAVDFGMAIIGFFKFLPIALYLLSLWQEENGKEVLEALPFVAAVMVIVSSVGSLFLPNLFLVSQRLAGFFQYPNTFALLLLLSELLILKKAKLKLADYIILAVLIGGLLYTGSRTVFLLFIASNFFMILFNAPKKARLWIFLTAAAAGILLLAVAFFGPDGNVLARYLKIGFTQSTFVGRILYVVDALPLLLKYPFGLGYLGYHFLQGGIQSGVYNVSYVHNELLQLALDIGIIPALLFAAAVISFFFKKHISLEDKIIVATFTLHNLFDFNLQFVGMFMLYILLLEDFSGKEILVKKPNAFKIAVSIVAVINLYMSVSLALSQFTLYDASNALYPFNTRNKLLLLEQQTDVVSANEIADEILAQNTSYYAPYSVKAKYCYSKGDFVGVIENKNEVFLKNRFRYTEYKEYGVMLVNGIIAYEQIGDNASANVLKKELLNLQKGMELNKQRVSKLGNMIDEKPVTTLPSDILDYIDKITNEAGDLY